MPPQSGAGSVNIWNNREKEKEAGLAAASCEILIPLIIMAL